MKTLTLLLVVLMAFLALYACKPDDPTNEEEVITTVKLEVVGPTGLVTYQWRDVDGAGGTAPVIDEVKLDASEIYSVSVLVLNESDTTQVRDLTVEIRNEKNDHRFCYTPGAGLPVVINILDIDDNTRPVGLSTSWLTGNSGAVGEVTVELKHQPGIKDGTCTPGETDVQVIFPVRINF